MANLQATPQLRNPLMESLRAGKLGLAMIIKQVQSIDIAIAAKTCGYDAISVDLEHSVIPESAAAQICVAALNVGVTPLVRVPSHDAYYATRILDAGALGIIAPHVNTADEARRVVSACRFAPLGERSVAANWPHIGYQTIPAREARELLNRQTTVIVMLETREAVDNAAEIAAVPGVDILHVGSNDLCETLGIPGEFDHPDLERALKRVIDGCGKSGKFAGIGGVGSAPEVAKKIIRLGARFVTVGNEWAFMMAAARQKASVLRELTLQ